MEFPRFVYKPFGSNEFKGKRYSYLQVSNEEEYASAISLGWYDNRADAFDSLDVKKEETKTEEPNPEKDPETPKDLRAELEKTARELGIKFDGRTSDKKLMASIESAVKAKE